MTKPKNVPRILEVQIIEAKPNKMFSEEQRAGVRFLRYNQSIPCAECKKKRRVMWTSLFTFYAYSMDGMIGMPHGPAHPPLTPVCGAHPMGPAFDEESNGKSKK